MKIDQKFVIRRRGNKGLSDFVRLRRDIARNRRNC